MEGKSWTSKVSIDPFPVIQPAELDTLREAVEIDADVISALISEIRGLCALCRHALEALNTHDSEYHYVTPTELLEKLEEVVREG